MWHCIVFFTVLLMSLSGVSFNMSFRPLEQIRYRSGACEEDLERLTYALLKDHTYTGCLETALFSLQRKGTLLSRQFEHIKGIKYGRTQISYDPLLKQILIREISKRLEKEEPFSSFLDRPLLVTEASHDAFVSVLNKFCRHSKEMTNAYAQERLSRIVHGVELINLQGLFEGFRKTWMVAESLESREPQILKGMKHLRNRFLVVLNQMVILKKALGGIPLQEGVDLEDIMYKTVLRTEWIDAYHVLKSHAMMSDICLEDKAVCKKAFEEMDLLVLIIQSLDDLKNICWTKKRPRQYFQ